MQCRIEIRKHVLLCCFSYSVVIIPVSITMHSTITAVINTTVIADLLADPSHPRVR